MRYIGSHASWLVGWSHHSNAAAGPRVGPLHPDAADHSDRRAPCIRDAAGELTRHADRDGERDELAVVRDEAACGPGRARLVESALLTPAQVFEGLVGAGGQPAEHLVDEGDDGMAEGEGTVVVTGDG